MSDKAPSLISAQQHIVQIRREKFSLDADGTLLSQNPLAKDLHNSAERLSADLYSKDTHFVLELIQNAEDNAYPPGVQPDLTFCLLPEDPTATPGAHGALLILNNECGLRPEDVDALCAVGRSTKTKRQGYIGEKGIGFKSVFKVTKRPHLFSAGYQFRFDRDPDPAIGLGYIVPYWVDDVPPEVASQHDKTCILLPLDEGQWEPVIAQLQRIAPETILFLSRLEGLTVELPGDSPLRLLIDKSKAPLVDLMDDETLATYWVHQREVRCPPDQGDEKRIGVETRTVSIAFPLARARKPTYSVFAYLPTEMQSGYPFLINADFILTSSREAILMDRPWNRWLRDEIAPCFVEGFVALVRDPRYWQQAYGFIPLADKVQEPFFQSPVKRIHQELANLPVVWVIGKQEPVAPPHARLAPSTFRELLDGGRPLPEQLMRTLLVRSELERFDQQLRAIGVKALQPDEVRACLQDEAWLEDRSPEWFVKLFAYLQQDKWRVPARYEREAKSLEGLKIIPTTEGRLAAVGKETVYLPEAQAEAMAREHVELLGSLAVAFLDADLYCQLKTKPELLDWVQKNLARPWTAEAYCRDLVEALVRNGGRLSPAELVQATQLVRDLTEQAQAKGARPQDLCARLPLRLEDGNITTIKDGEIVTPPNLDLETGWQEVFPDAADRVGLRILSTCYLELCTDDQERERWRKFLAALGLTDTPIPTQSWKWWSLRNLPKDMPQMLRVQIQDKWPNSTRGYSLSDVRPPQWLQALANTGDASALTMKRAKALLRWLKQGLDSYRLQSTRRLCYFYYTDHSLSLRSELHRLLHLAPWLPTTQGSRRPGEVFLDKPEVREIFGDTVPYAAEPIDPKLAEWLGVRASATTDQVLDFLEQLAQKPAAEVDAKLVQRIYSFLLERWRNNPSSTQGQRFDQKALIYVSRPAPRWARASDAIWSDRSGVFGEEFAYLEPEYPRLREFFVDRLSVKADADDELYARAWLKLQQQDAPDPARVEAALERIFPVLRRVAEGGDDPSWWGEFLAQARVWTQDDRFASPTEAFVPDDGELKKLLGKVGARFVWRPEKDSFADYQALYQALGVRLLTEALHCRLANIGDPIEAAPGKETYLCAPAKRGICFYLWDHNKDEFRRLQKDGVLAALLGAREAQVDNLELHYQLDGIRAVDDHAVVYFDREQRTLYLSAAAPPPQLDIEVPDHLARTLAKGRLADELRGFIASFLGKTEQHLQYLVEKEDWRLPLEQREWMERAIAGQLELSPLAKDVDAPSEEASSLEVQPAEPASADERLGTAEVPVQPEAPFAPQPSAPEEVEAMGAPAPAGDFARFDQVEHADNKKNSSPIHDGSGSARVETVQGADGRSDHGDGHGAIQSRPSPFAQPQEPASDRKSQARRSAYLEPESVMGCPGARIDPNKQAAIEEAGLAAVEAYERKHGRKPERRGRQHPGWDVDSYASPFQNDTQPDRRIEVKATEGAWSDWGIALTPNEHDTARRYPETYYLYVVEHALDEERRRIYVFRNPAAKITEYRLAQNWRAYADETA